MSLRKWFFEKVQVPNSTQLYLLVMTLLFILWESFRGYKVIGSILLVAVICRIGFVVFDRVKEVDMKPRRIFRAVWEGPRTYTQGPAMVYAIALFLLAVVTL